MGVAAHRERHGVATQFEIGSGDAGSQRLLKAPQHSPHARCEFAGAERFGDVIVGPKIQAADAIFLTCPRGKKDDRNAGKVMSFTNLAADFKAAVTRNHNVEQK